MAKPNILMIMTDQQSFNMMSCAGNAYVKTPKLDALAADALRFESCWCANPVCLPSRFSLFTGRYPSEAGFRDNSYRREINYLPEEIMREGFAQKLREAGYETVYGGKEHLPYMGAAELGFDCICRDERDKLAAFCENYLLRRKNEKPFMMVASFINPHDICLMAINDFAAQSDNREDRFLRFLLKTETKNVNEARKLPKGVSRKEFFEKLCPPLPDNYLPSDDEPEFISMLQAERGFKRLAREKYSDEDWRLHRWAYSRLTEQVDAQIGRVLDALKKSGQYENTVVIFTSDHGDMDASHKMEHKENLYQEACHVPLIIKGVGRHPAGELCPFTVCNGLDFIPTVLDYAGAEKPEYLEGVSLRGFAQGEEKCRRRLVVTECAGGDAVTDGRFRLTRYFKGERAEQLYDLLENPGESRDQSGELCYSDVLAELRAALDAHIEKQRKKCLYDPLAAPAKKKSAFSYLAGSRSVIPESMKRR